MVVRITELNSGPGGSTVYTDLEVPEDKTAHAGDLLMSWSGRSMSTGGREKKRSLISTFSR